MPLARAGDIELSYEHSGSGPPLLLIMGMSGTFSHWGELLLQDLRRDFEVIVYDHRGVGASTRVSEPFTISDLAVDAAGLLAALDLDRVHVMGISMGGMVAQELALAHPEAVHTLALGCTYCGGIGSSRARRATLQRLAQAAASGDRECAVRASWEVNVSAEFAGNDDAYATYLEIGQRRRVALSVVMEQVRAINAHDTSERLPSIGAPTLVVHGTADEMISVENGRMVASLIPGSRLELFEGAGHLFFWEEPQRSAELLRAHALSEAQPVS